MAPAGRPLPLAIEQALLIGDHAESCRVHARSPGFDDSWLAEAERLCLRFAGQPPSPGMPLCLFVQPFGKKQVAIVQLSTDRGGAPVFRLLVLWRGDYLLAGGNPFEIAEHFPPDWTCHGELPTLSLSSFQPRLRTVEQIQQALQREGPLLLGGAQALVDGGRLVFERAEPDEQLLHDLWAVLPTATRSELWPATFTLANPFRFHVAVTPHADREEFAGYLTETQAAEYPEGRYELGLQVAAESGDQRELNALFARRSRAETWRIGIMLLILVTVLVVLGQLLMGPAPAPGPRAVPHRPERIP